MALGVDLRTTGASWIAAAVIGWLIPGSAAALEISDSPMETMVHAAPPVVVLLLDNSASMDSELMTAESLGTAGEAVYVFPDSAYLPRPDHVSGVGHALDEDQRRAWKTRWAGHNRVYYTPDADYAPWPSTIGHTFGPADLHRPLSDPTASGSRAVRLDLSAVFFSVSAPPGQVSVPNAHYFTRSHTGDQGTFLVFWEDADGDGRLDLGGRPDDDRRRYFRFTDDGDGLVEGHELAPVTRDIEKNRIRPWVRDARGGFVRYATDREELQNFANWFSFHRRRILAAKAAAAALVDRSRESVMGLFAVNGEPRMAARPVLRHAGRPAVAEAGDDAVHHLLDAIYGMACGGRTALRQALEHVGRYCHQELTSPLGPSPFAAQGDGGGCQRASVVVLSDGFWNGPAPAVGNADGAEGRPFADGWPDTLADVAMRLYTRDLAPGLPDAVPPMGCDDAVHQHLTTTTLTLGIPVTAPAPAGDGQPPADVCRSIDAGPDMNWSAPMGDGAPELPWEAASRDPAIRQRPSGSASNDLWHAAVNGRGQYLDMRHPRHFEASRGDPQAVSGGFACAAGVTVSSGLLSDQSVIYQGRYNPEDWRGEVTAVSSGGEGPPLWRASDWLAPAPRRWDTRRVVTYGGDWRQARGVPFRFDELSAGQKAALVSGLEPRLPADTGAQKLVAFVRGREIEGFRKRQSLLGDVVHAAPVLFGQTLFVGSNDGMLHAFDAQNGKERFAYVPNLVLSNLNALASPTYGDRHRFFVDGPVHAGEVRVGPHQRKTYLVGGLGKGGRGYYCLLVGHRERSRIDGGFGDYQWIRHVDQLSAANAEADVAEVVQWEYPRPQIDRDDMDNDGDGLVDEAGETDPDMGFSFGQGYAVDGNAPDGGYRPMVVLANGYDSPGQSAVLYILSADTGRLIRKIDTGVNGDNGLSTPALVDADLDRRVDYVYAGDLRGNLWKFDLSDPHADRWGPAYGEDLDGDGVIKAHRGDIPLPLFYAVDQPITGRPDVMVMNSACAGQVSGHMVVFGTGRYLGAPDRSDDSRQSIYGIWDFGDDSDDSEYLGSLVNRDSGKLSSGYYLQRRAVRTGLPGDGAVPLVLEKEKIDYVAVEDGGDGDGSSANSTGGSQQGDPARFAGWFHDLTVAPQGAAAERVTADAVLRSGKAIFTSFQPGSAPCGSGGESRVYIVSGCHGSIVADAAQDPIPPLAIPGRIGDRVAVMKDGPDARIDKILFSDQQGRIRTIDIMGEHWGQVSWRQTIAD